MPNLLTAKVMGERSLKLIGAFPPTQSSPDPAELKTALQWLEMILNFQSGAKPTAGLWDIIDIPVEAGIGDYNLNDYTNRAGAIHVFSVSILNRVASDPIPLDIIYENEGVLENLSDASMPTRAVITKDVSPVLKVFPTPTQSNQDQGDFFRLRIQTYHTPINPNGTGDEDLLIRPSWYLWLVKKLAYELALGPVRRLPEGELGRLEKDCDKLEKMLYAQDGQYNVSTPPIQEPMPGSML